MPQLPSPYILRTINACIYCGKTEPEVTLTTEHLIPYSLGGVLVLEKASCLPCADMTKKIEQYAGRQIFQDVRIEFGIQTRRPAERPTHLPLRESFSPSPQLAPIRLVPTKDYPGMLFLMAFEPAGYLSGRPSTRGQRFMPFVRVITGRERVDALKAKGIPALIYRELKPDRLARLLAKIALCYAVACYGLDAFRPLVRGVILDFKTDPFPWVGGVDALELPDPTGPNPGHRVLVYNQCIGDMPCVLVQMQLFAFLGAPIYTVVVGDFFNASDN